eukprot:12783695-Prorocentrum_lima.AAC.1
MNFVVTQIEKDEAGRVIRLIGRSNPEGSPKTTKLKVAGSLSSVLVPPARNSAQRVSSQGQLDR